MPFSVIRVEHLVKRFGKATVVDDISFEVSAGEIFALLTDPAGNTWYFAGPL